MTVARPLIKENATLEDLEALPESMRGEIIDGVLYAMARSRSVHQALIGEVYTLVSDAFQRGRGGPGGWWILPEPGIELPRAKEFSPDVAGWTRARLPKLPRDHSITVAPDWVCEVLSPTTRRHNLLVKRPFYASIGLPWLWLVDLEAMVLSVQRNDDGAWREVAVLGDEREARVPPFEATPIDLRAWWDAIDVAAP